MVVLSGTGIHRQIFILVGEIEESGSSVRTQRSVRQTLLIFRPGFFNLDYRRAFPRQARCSIFDSDPWLSRLGSVRDSQET